MERVEIVRGAASSIYGSNAVGGVINLIPRTSAEPWTANVNARYGAYDNQRYGTTLSFRAGNFNNSFNLQRLSQGRIEYFNPDTEGAKGSYDSMDPTASWNFKDRLTFTPNNQLKLTANVGYYYRERERSSSEDNRYRDFTGGLKGRYLFSKGQSLEVSYAFDQYDKSDFDKVKRSDVRDYSNVQNSFRALYNHTFNRKHILTVGGDYLYDYLASYMFSGGETYRQYTADAFAQFDWNPNRHFNAVASARYDYYSEAKAQNFSPQLNLMYKLRNCSLRGSYAVGFRAPTLKEMYSAFDMGSIWWIYGNEHLKPEKSHNFSLSAEYFKSRYNLTVTGYYNLVNDRIAVQWDPSLENGKGAMMYTNIRKMKMAGANVDAAAKYPCGNPSVVCLHLPVGKIQPICFHRPSACRNSPFLVWKGMEKIRIQCNPERPPAFKADHSGIQRYQRSFERKQSGNLSGLYDVETEPDSKHLQRHPCHTDCRQSVQLPAILLLFQFALHYRNYSCSRCVCRS